MISNIWKAAAPQQDLVGIEELYEVDMDGRVRQVETGKVYNENPDHEALLSPDGSKTVTLVDKHGEKRSKSIRRLVAETFLPIQGSNVWSRVKSNDETLTIAERLTWQILCGSVWYEVDLDEAIYRLTFHITASDDEWVRESWGVSEGESYTMERLDEWFTASGVRTALLDPDSSYKGFQWAVARERMPDGFVIPICDAPSKNTLPPEAKKREGTKRLYRQLEDGWWWMAIQVDTHPEELAKGFDLRPGEAVVYTNFDEIDTVHPKDIEKYLVTQENFCGGLWTLKPYMKMPDSFKPPQQAKFGRRWQHKGYKAPAPVQGPMAAMIRRNRRYVHEDGAWWQVEYRVGLDPKAKELILDDSLPPEVSLVSTTNCWNSVPIEAFRDGDVLHGSQLVREVGREKMPDWFDGSLVPSSDVRWDVRRPVIGPKHKEAREAAAAERKREQAELQARLEKERKEREAEAERVRVRDLRRAELWARRVTPIVEKAKEETERMCANAPYWSGFIKQWCRLFGFIVDASVKHNTEQAQVFDRQHRRRLISGLQVIARRLNGGATQLSRKDLREQLAAIVLEEGGEYVVKPNNMFPLPRNTGQVHHWLNKQVPVPNKFRVQKKRTGGNTMAAAFNNATRVAQ